MKFSGINGTISTVNFRDRQYCITGLQNLFKRINIDPVLWFRPITLWVSWLIKYSLSTLYNRYLFCRSDFTIIECKYGCRIQNDGEQFRPEINKRNLWTRYLDKKGGWRDQKAPIEKPEIGVDPNWDTKLGTNLRSNLAKISAQIRDHFNMHLVMHIIISLENFLIRICECTKWKIRKLEIKNDWVSNQKEWVSKSKRLPEKIIWCLRSSFEREIARIRRYEIANTRVQKLSWLSAVCKNRGGVINMFHTFIALEIPFGNSPTTTRTTFSYVKIKAINTMNNGHFASNVMQYNIYLTTLQQNTKTY